MKKGLPSQPKLVGLVVAELPAVSRPAARPLVCRNPFQLHSLRLLSTLHHSGPATHNSPLTTYYSLLTPPRLPSPFSLLTSPVPSPQYTEFPVLRFNLQTHRIFRETSGTGAGIGLIDSSGEETYFGFAAPCCLGEPAPTSGKGLDFSGWQTGLPTVPSNNPTVARNCRTRRNSNL